MINAFILAGQSNMSGRGVLGEMPELENEHVLVLRGGAWETAREPVVRDRPFSGEGMATMFGLTLHALTGRDIGFIPCSLGGSELDQWQAGEELFEKMLCQTDAALKSGARIAGVLWHQGEMDSESEELARTYGARFIKMLAALEGELRAQAVALGQSELVAAPLPIIAGELGDYLDDFPDTKYHREINAQLREFAALRPEYACVTAHDLKDKGDKLHFSTRSQRTLGLRYACAWSEAAARVGVTLI